MILETKRLILRPWEETDAEECFKYSKDPRVGLPCGWAAHTDVEYSRRIIREILAVPETYAMVLKSTGLPVGSISLHFDTDLTDKENECEMGYWIGVPYWGQGLTPEAANELLRHAFCDLGVTTVFAGYFEGNLKSRRVQEKCGFKFRWASDDVPVPALGESRKGYVTAVTKEEWESLIGRSANAD